MGSGLSMASVNKIKELAEQREYNLALDIVDSQDLSKSLNPQFLRICGDIYMYNGRYVDSRKMYLMAHKLAPEGKRVIYSLIYLYLRMGYMDLAKRYYDLYLFDADELSEETNQVKYIFGKAHKADFDELYALLCPHYIHNMDYDWSFETYLLLKKMGNDDEASILASDYTATFKNSKNSEYISDIEDGKEIPDKHYDVFAAEIVLDEDPEQEDLRKVEAVLLEADDLRVNPKEAEITIMVDDFEEVDIGTKRRLKKMLKSEEKENKKNKDQEVEDGSSDNEETEDAIDTDDTKEQDELASTEDAAEVLSDDTVEKQQKVGLFKKIFAKKKHSEEQEDEGGEDTTEEEKSSDSVGTEKVEEQESDVVSQESEANEVEEESPEEKEEDSMRELHTNKHNPVISIDFDSDDFAAESDTIEGLKDEDFANPFDDISVFKKEKEEPIFVPKRKTEFSFDDLDFSSDDEDEFEIDDFSLPDDEFGAMNDSCSDDEDGLVEENYETESDANVEEYVEEACDEEETEVEDEVDVDENYEAEEIESVEEVYDTEDEEYAEESYDIESAETDEYESDANVEEYVEETYEEEAEVEDEVVEEYEAEEIESVEEVYDIEDEEYAEESYDIESEVEDEVVEDYETGTVESTYDESDANVEEYVEETYEEEAEAEDEVEVVEDYEAEEIESVEEVYDTEDEEYAEESYDIESAEADKYESDANVEEEEYVEETYDEEETEVEDTYETEMIETESDMESQSYTGVEVEDDVEINVPVEKVVPEKAKSKLDFPVFRSSLFPNHNKEIKQVENNFNEIMAKGQDKIQENLLKEEQMQREAEALLASLGIDLGSITVSNDSMESINKTLYNEPSRDELKASLKIDSVKKDILKKIKEYR